MLRPIAATRLRRTAFRRSYGRLPALSQPRVGPPVLTFFGRRSALRQREWAMHEKKEEGEFLKTVSTAALGLVLITAAVGMLVMHLMK